MLRSVVMPRKQCGRCQQHYYHYYFEGDHGCVLFKIRDDADATEVPSEVYALDSETAVLQYVEQYDEHSENVIAGDGKTLMVRVERLDGRVEVWEANGEFTPDYYASRSR